MPGRAPGGAGSASLRSIAVNSVAAGTTIVFVVAPAFTVTRDASLRLGVPGKYVGAKPSASVLLMFGLIIIICPVRLFAEMK